MRVKLATLTLAIASPLLLPSSAKADMLQYDFTSSSLASDSLTTEIPAANNHLATHKRWVLGTSILLFSWPSTAWPDSTDVPTITFAGSDVCVVVVGPCGSAMAAPGAYSFDPDTPSVASSDTGAFVSFGEPESFPTVAGGIPWLAGYGQDSLSFSTSNGRVLLGFADSQNYSAPVTLSAGGGLYHLRFLSQTNTNPTPNATPVRAPEPSSLLLLDCGLFGLLAMASFGSRIRRFAASDQSQSPSFSA